MAEVGNVIKGIGLYSSKRGSDEMNSSFVAMMTNLFRR